MDLPIIETPIAPRWMWMEEVTYSHIPIATLITAFLVIAPIFEYIGFRKKDPRYDRLAKSMVFFVMILYSPGAALGTGIPIFIIGMWPEFWSRWANLFYWPLFYQFLFFLLDVIFLFFGYYLTWDRMMDRKRLHIFFGVMSAIFGLLIQAVWDSLGSYMTTPGAPFPMVNDPVGWSAQAFFNPSFPYLFFHRFFGNISYTMLLLGGVFALKYWRQKQEEEKVYFGWAADLTFSIGFMCFFAMPFIGWSFAKLLQQQSPIVFHSIMGGHASSFFLLKMGFIAIMILLGAVYLFKRRQRKALLYAATVGLASMYLTFHFHPALDWLPGGPLVWRAAYTVAIGGFLVYLWFSRAGEMPLRPRWQWVMFSVGIAAFFAFALGGFVRERSRQPYNVYLTLVKPEALPVETDRALTYQKCLGCHLASPNEFERHKGANWAQIVQREREMGRAQITDQEAKRIVNYLEENF